MYKFPDEIRKAYESQPIALVYDQYIDGKVVPLLVSDGFCELVGMDREHAVAWFRNGQFERLHPDDVGRVVRVSDEFIRHEGGYDVIFRSKHEDGYHIIHAIGRWQIMPDGTELALLTYSDLTANIDAMSGKIEDYHLFRADQFYTDPLTGLPNLNYLNQFADERVHALRISGKTPVLLYVDIDAMTSYNSQYGYEKGSELICLVARTLKEVFPNALVMRGPEDHFFLVDAFDSQDKTAGLITEANWRIKNEAEGNATGIKVGAYIYEEAIVTAEAMECARNALKWIGTDMTRSCNFHTSDADDQFWKERYIIENFDIALENGWIKVYYQGINRTATGKGAAFEALSRWVDPVRGIISPGEFIPVLSRYHLLYKLDLFMAGQVCRDIPLRVEHGLPLVPVSVNFSAQDFDYVDVPAELDRVYNQYWPHPDTNKNTDENIDRNIDKNYLIVEITEQDMAQATERFVDQLGELRKLGFRIWLDDFGSGYSSLNVFSRFEVDLIKFDMELLQHLNDRNGVNRHIMKAMVEIAREMGIHTLAEGVETDEQRIFLQEIGCELSQGYLLHRPEPLASFFYRLKTGKRTRQVESPEERERFNREWFESRSTRSSDGTKV